MEERKMREIAYYDKQAADETAQQESYSPVLESHKFLYRIAAPFMAGKRVLDYGCGEGIHLPFLAKHAREVVGVDLSEGALRRAKQGLSLLHGKGNVALIKMDCEKLEFPAQSFDVVFDGGTFSSLDFEKALAEITRVLGPDGQLLGIETFGHNPFANAKRVYNKITGKRTAWASSHIVRQKEITMLRQRFESCEVRYFHLLSLFAFPFFGVTRGVFALRVLEGFDRILLKIPFLQKYAFKIVFVCSKPKT